MPPSSKIYHITHADNIASIVAANQLRCDMAITAAGGPPVSIGMGHIKGSRFRRPVPCHPGDMVAEYVPFNFCPRSVMLYLIYMANHPQLTYRGGQGPIVHLQADMDQVVGWADKARVRWAATQSNAAAAYAEFICSKADLHRIPWDDVANNDFRTEKVKEGKQAEFLLHGGLPWDLVVRIGVRSMVIKSQVEAAMATAVHRPAVTIEPSWYF